MFTGVNRFIIFLTGVAVGVLIGLGEWEAVSLAGVLYGTMMVIILSLARKYPKETDG